MKPKQNSLAINEEKGISKLENRCSRKGFFHFEFTISLLPGVPVAGASLGSKTSMSRLTCNGSVLSGLISSKALLVT